MKYFYYFVLSADFIVKHYRSMLINTLAFRQNWLQTEQFLDLFNLSLVAAQTDFTKLATSPAQVAGYNLRFIETITDIVTHMEFTSKRLALRTKLPTGFVEGLAIARSRFSFGNFGLIVVEFVAKPVAIPCSTPATSNLQPASTALILMDP